jgi:hypothetical protein
MKNIHLLPTEKPSVLYKRNDLNTFHLGDFDICEPNDTLRTNQHIYITSDEEIKEGDWMIRGNEQPTLVTHDFFWDFGDRYHKIILTTDQDLIADGVQAIDDEFLEWFVKNPSCESVETKVVDFEVDMGLGDECIEHSSYYKIIIPQEKNTIITDWLDKHGNPEIDNKVKKQLELEEAADNWVFETNGHKWSNNDNTAGDNYGSFKAGAKWQAERMYSEDEVRNIANWAFDFYKTDEFSDSELEDEFNRILSERFKKK